MRSGLLVLGLVAGSVAGGCGFRSSPGEAIDSGTGGGNGDGGNGDGNRSCPTGFASLLDTCALVFDGDLMLSGTAVYNTTTHVLTVGGVPRAVAVKTITLGTEEVDVLSARNVQLAASATLDGTGPRPLAIVASDSITVASDTQIRVSAGGAGARMSCPKGATAGASDTLSINKGAGGGGGGGYGADGGDGGTGNLDGTRSPGGSRGHAVGSVPTGLQGGCRGADGGSADAPGGAGGAGGGALYLVAANRIQLDSSAVIDAGGEGGHGGHLNATGGDAGGGGGGSGGMLILEAAHIMATDAAITANGGGGGGGSDSAHLGGNGDPGTLTTSTASGGSGGSTSGTRGGAGGSKDAPTGGSVTVIDAGGGGGGGGGVGIIRILSSDAQLGVVSPDPHA